MKKALRKEISSFVEKEIAGEFYKKISKGYSFKDFNINPFSLVALSRSVFGGVDGMSLAKTLIYPRLLGTSFATTFGDKMQKLCVSLLPGKASPVPGMDIEFFDQVDKIDVIMQLKAGPNTINTGNVAPIVESMNKAYRLLKQNRATRMPIFSVGITYGVISEISGHYKAIGAASVGVQDNIPILIGADFWHRLTGEKKFYDELINIFDEVFSKQDLSKNVTAEIKKFARKIDSEEGRNILN